MPLYVHKEKNKHSESKESIMFLPTYARAYMWKKKHIYVAGMYQHTHVGMCIRLTVLSFCVKKYMPLYVHNLWFVLLWLLCVYCMCIHHNGVSMSVCICVHMRILSMNCVIPRFHNCLWFQGFITVHRMLRLNDTKVPLAVPVVIFCVHMHDIYVVI